MFYALIRELLSRRCILLLLIKTTVPLSKYVLHNEGHNRLRPIEGRLLADHVRCGCGETSLTLYHSAVA